VFDGYRAGGRLAADGESHAPFGADRTGIVLGEAGVVLVLEEREHALARGAQIMAELLGVGQGVGFETAGRGARAAAERAPDVVLAHANGSPSGDAAEATALAAQVGSRTPVTSIKPLAGECGGAAGGLQVVASCVMLQEACIPAIGSLQAADSAVELDLVAGEARKTDVNTVLLNSMDSGGDVVTLVVGRDRGQR
jgi:3-oxoacyl-(acyl-carrier-protein) synthase